ncbi:MAG: anthranilate synthase component I family protein [Actinobacteria bacterium]|nr:MAG: anthranilate synthase component I family protein [Actinomycetota bacterium]
MEGVAWVGGRVFTDLVDTTDDVAALDSPGSWVVVLPFSAPPVCAHFARAGAASSPARLSPWGWSGPARASWVSSMSREEHAKAVLAVRELIAAGDVYEVNVCRRLSAPLRGGCDLVELGAVLAHGHPAPHAATVVLPGAGVFVASASPELFLRRHGRVVESRPVKGTAARPGGFTAKDRAENVMIVDLVRNDLGRVCEYGSVEVPALWAVEAHPGLFHLVSTVRGRLRPQVGWAELVRAGFPPGSVTGAPKLAALDAIAELEPVPRGVYCGAVGWVDGDSQRGELNVAIRTFWWEEGRLCYGTGGAVTWDSTPEGEWAETELKAARALAVACPT